jgi:hypothetical protein
MVGNFDSFSGKSWLFVRVIALRIEHLAIGVRLSLTGLNIQLNTGNFLF